MGIVISRESIQRTDEQTIYHDDGTMQRIEATESVYITTEQPLEENAAFVDIGFEIHKARDEQRLVSGWASVSINADGSIPMDWDDDIIPPEVLEKAAINFMLDYRDSGAMHKGNSVGTIVESIVFTKDKQEALGIPDGVLPIGWFITVKVHDEEVYAKVKDGKYRMFSIQGVCKRSVL